MRFARRSLILLAAVAASAFARDIDGTWKVWFTGDRAYWPKMLSEMTFDLKAQGDKLIGTAHMSKWPGEAPISGGKIDGERFSLRSLGNYRGGPVGVSPAAIRNLISSEDST